MRLAASSRSFGRYSWKKLGVAPVCGLICSIGAWANVESVNGTPVAAEARAAATSPWKSGAHKPIRPMGHIKIGLSKRWPNNVIDRSRSGGKRLGRLPLDRIRVKRVPRVDAIHGVQIDAHLKVTEIAWHRFSPFPMFPHSLVHRAGSRLERP